MRRFERHALGIDRGSVVMFSDFQNGGEMWTGSGPREARRSVTFSERFVDPPIVQVSLSMWDTDGKSNQRADISADAVTAEGFELVFKTWGDSRVARVRADWTAIGGLRNADDWDVD